MRPRCDAPIPDETLLDYWARDLADGEGADRVEEHLFACGDCSARLQRMASHHRMFAGDHIKNLHCFHLWCFAIR